MQKVVEREGKNNAEDREFKQGKEELGKQKKRKMQESEREGKSEAEDTECEKESEVEDRENEELTNNETYV